MSIERKLLERHKKLVGTDDTQRTIENLKEVHRKLVKREKAMMVKRWDRQKKEFSNREARPKIFAEQNCLRK